jgi:diguanylate cyclase (GGDEF)-like protein/hemerythrin-like metal-binding protein
MTNAASHAGPGASGTRLPLLLALVAAGVAGNHCKFPVFVNTDFLFGSIFSMLVLQFFGLGRGVPAAAVIAGYTYVLWNHPYAIVIMTLEVAAVGWLMQRRKIGMLQADSLYWLLVGMPLVYLFYHVVMQVPLNSSSMIAIKQALNGIANALAARLLFSGYLLRTRSALVDLRETICNLMALFVLLPALSLLAIGSRKTFTDTDLRIREILKQDAQHLHLSIADWVTDRKTVMAHLAELAAQISAQQMQASLIQAAKSDANFRKFAFLDLRASTVACYPPYDELGQSTIGRNYTAPSALAQLPGASEPVLSEIDQGILGSATPTVAILAPVRVTGGSGGYVTGELSFQQLKTHLDTDARRQGILYTLLDNSGRVILSNWPRQRAMTPFVRGKGSFVAIDGGIRQWLPVIAPNTPFFERWKNSHYVSESEVGETAQWKLITELQVAPFQRKLNDEYTRKLTLLFAALVVSLGLAEGLSRRIMVTIEKLSSITRDLPSRLATGTTIDWPVSGLKESSDLIDNFRDMSASVQNHLLELRHLNDSLELRVEERTRQLLEQKQFIRSTIDGLSANICVIDDAGTIVITNRAWDRFAADNGAAADACGEGSNYLEACRCTSGEDLATTEGVVAGIRAVLDGLLPEFVQEYPCHAPEQQRWFLCRVNPFTVSHQRFAVISHEEVTKRKLSEQALEESYCKLEAVSRTDDLTGIANRRYFDLVLEQERARHARSGAELSLIFLDIDYFKRFNDCYGHLEGDQCLRQIARVLADCMARTSDLAARYGGEEFACIMPETDQNGALLLAEKIRRGIAALAIPHKESTVADHVTASLGVVSVRCLVGGSATSIVAQADDLLYRAKSRGRNRIEFAVPSHTGELNDRLVQLVWSDAFSCGNRQIDAQHQALFQAANELLRVALSGHASVEVPGMVSRLLDDIAGHFEEEDEILEAAGFPGRKQHAAEHAELLARGRELSRNYSETHSWDIFRFLIRDVVLVHMLGADREFAAYLNGGE